MKRGKIFITILSVVLWGLLVSMLTTNCKNKNSGGRAESAVNTGRVINMSSPPFEKFVVVTNEGTELYKNADTNSPTLVGWVETYCTSDHCDSFYQWSYQPARHGFEQPSMSTITYEGKVFPVLSEEGAHLPYEERCHWSRLWIVDPLDGTKEFIKRNGEFTVNIALVENGTPVMGVIYRPTPIPSHKGRDGGGALYFGQTRPLSENDKVGAWRTSIDASTPIDDTSSLHTALERSEALTLKGDRGKGRSPFTVVASRSHLSPETADFIGKLRCQHPDLELISSGSSLKICLVAEGKADVYPRHAPTMEWDTAAGHAIALAAGREMVDAHTGKPLTYNKPDLHNPWFIVR